MRVTGACVTCAAGSIRALDENAQKFWLWAAAQTISPIAQAHCQGSHQTHIHTQLAGPR
jgi:hypothetical protein